MTERESQIGELLTTPGWRQVALPALKARLEALRRKLATDQRLSLEEVRRLQVQYGLLVQLVEEPEVFFTLPAD
jgi:hypothetical protein